MNDDMSGFARKLRLPIFLAVVACLAFDFGFERGADMGLGQVSLTVLGLIGACAFLLTHADWRDS